MRKYPRIAVLDTHMLSKHAETQDVRVYHTSAFAQIFDEPEWDLGTEYLIYKKVSGPAFHVVCVDRIQEVANLVGSCWRTPEGQGSTATSSRHKVTKDEAVKAKKFAEMFKRDDRDQPDVTVAIVAAQLARLQYDTGVPFPYPKPLTLSIECEEKDVHGRRHSNSTDKRSGGHGPNTANPRQPAPMHLRSSKCRYDE